MHAVKALEALDVRNALATGHGKLEARSSTRGVFGHTRASVNPHDQEGSSSSRRSVIHDAGIVTICCQEINAPVAADSV